MRRIAIINQKGGVGKTTTSVNLGAALAEQGRRVVVCDLDPQANLSLHMGIEPGAKEPSTYTVLHGATTLAESLKQMSMENFRVLPSNIDLSGAELELASAIGRDNLLADAIDSWVEEHQKEHGEEPADYLIIDCPPSLGLLSVNALAAANEVIITVQTEFLALMGMSKLVDVVALIQRRLNPNLVISGIAACLYDSRLRLAREVLGEIRKYFPGQVFKQPIRSNVKLAEAPSFGQSIVEYAPESNGALDYRKLGLEVIAQEEKHPELSHLKAPRPIEKLKAPRQESSSANGAVPSAATRPRIDRAPRPKQRPVPTAGTITPAAEPEIRTPKKDTPVVEVAHKLEPSEPVEVLTPHNAQPKSKGGEPAPQQETVHSEANQEPRRDAVEEELHNMRNQDLPSLPPEAYELDN
jgi:chromosome partitioning protein